MSTPSPPTTESTSTATPISTKEISDLKQKFNVDTTELKNLNDGNTYKKDSVQKNISLETQHYELGLSESTQIQEQLNFCQDVQLEYIKKHEELKTVFALALNLFQFYTYTLEIIDSLLKIQTPEQKPGYFTERNVILTETKRNIEIDLISNYQPTKDAGGNITDIISVEEDTSIGISNDRQLGDDEFSNVFSAYTLTINNTGIKNDSENKFKKDNLKITATTINDNFKLTINKNGNAILSKNDINRNLELRLEITIEKSDGTQIKIFVNIYFISDLDITPNPSSAPPTTILSTPPPAGTPPAETGGKVYFNRIKDDTFGQLKKHQVELRKKLKGLNDLIAPPTITNLKLGGKEINIPLLNNAASGGGAIKSIVESKSSKQKKSKKEPFEISKVINQLIGGTPVDIPFFYTGEIVQKKLVNNSKYYFLELLQKSGSSSKSLLPSTLNANIKKKTYQYKLHEIKNKTDIETINNPNQYIKEEDTSSTTFQNRSEFINDIKQNVSEVDKANMLLDPNVQALFEKLELKVESFNQIDLCQQAFIRIKTDYEAKEGDIFSNGEYATNKLTVKIE